MEAVVISGSRFYKNEEKMRRILTGLHERHPNITLIVGDCKGADFIARKIAKERGIKLEIFEAYWDMYGKKAGPIRNKEMILRTKTFDEYYILIFHENLEKSKGTVNFISLLDPMDQYSIFR